MESAPVPRRRRFGRWARWAVVAAAAVLVSAAGARVALAPPPIPPVSHAAVRGLEPIASAGFTVVHAGAPASRPSHGYSVYGGRSGPEHGRLLLVWRAAGSGRASEGASGRTGRYTWVETPEEYREAAPSVHYRLVGHGLPVESLLWASDLLNTGDAPAPPGLLDAGASLGLWPLGHVDAPEGLPFAPRFHLSLVRRVPHALPAQESTVDVYTAPDDDALFAAASAYVGAMAGRQDGTEADEPVRTRLWRQDGQIAYAEGRGLTPAELDTVLAGLDAPGDAPSALLGTLPVSADPASSAALVSDDVLLTEGRDGPVAWSVRARSAAGVWELTAVVQGGSGTAMGDLSGGDLDEPFTAVAATAEEGALVVARVPDMAFEVELTGTGGWRTLLEQIPGTGGGELGSWRSAWVPAGVEPRELLARAVDGEVLMRAAYGG
ncbi:hypothetical protein [Allonocardiopsis opalescens]|uniref:Uncharacterized protein n=1 Tax=Allonocardiopsis opalescens TaxID=1144618 RepID=A0A2T0PXF0_9ACTN|nr:hypothetical protein [Allonocardiopsis opalescens]PRX96214.1 hypothetical protein CLV72_108220 [Allonocardiopsis opalescens]